MAGHFNKALSKGPNTTTWIWNLHADAHDFRGTSSLKRTSSLVQRKVFASNLAHLSVVFLWLGLLHFNGAYFSNYNAWLKDPKHSSPSSHLVWSIVGQDILNSDVGSYYFQGINTGASGMFQLWLSEGMICQAHLKYACFAALFFSILCIAGAYFHYHLAPSPSGLYKKFRSLRVHHISLLLGLGSISWAGHQVHIAVPMNYLMDSHVDTSVAVNSIGLGAPGFLTKSSGLGFSDISLLASSGRVLNPSTGSLFLNQIAAHHFYLGIVLILSGIFTLRNTASSIGTKSVEGSVSVHGYLSIALAITGSLSGAFAHCLTMQPVYPYFASDYLAVMASFVHHMWIAGFLIVGASAHGAIALLDMQESSLNSYISLILSHRDIITGHLSYVVLLLGMHSFGIYIHNDTMQALGRPEDMFSDSAIQLKPVFAKALLETQEPSVSIHLGKMIYSSRFQYWTTGDFMVHHIHAFTIHVALLVLLKGVLYSRSSRLVSDKSELGFRYPCDGPGRGGTCQISPFDHVYLGVFWMYNAVSVILFHYFWKMQSDCWGTVEQGGSTASGLKVMHITGGDFLTNSITINGWLRNFLWSQAAQVIQSYGRSISGYGLIFIGAHFIWAFSLMFLFSGRGYWQELIESIVWAHHKLKVIPSIQPRALSISQGRAVGLVHYILGGIGCTWSFFLARMVALST